MKLLTNELPLLISCLYIEYVLNSRLNQLMGDLNKYKSDGENAQKEYDDKMKDLQIGFSDTDKQQIRMEMSRVANDLNKKIDKKYFYLFKSS